MPNLLSMSEAASEESEPEVDDGDEVGAALVFSTVDRVNIVIFAPSTVIGATADDPQVNCVKLPL